VTGSSSGSPRRPEVQAQEATQPETPSQTVGPFLAIGLPWPEGPLVVPEGTPGAFWIRGDLRDGDGEVVQDALVETWQADPDGRFGGTSRGFGRCPTDERGRYAIHTRKPGPVPAPGGGFQAPHIDVSVFARGLLQRVVTRIYFADEPTNAADPVLASVPEDRRTTLIAEPDGDGYRFDIRLQGADETVFFVL
jgi:protocatechuate 3,4-dioxygenase alpha subunit